MSKYENLQRHLESLDADNWTAAFDEIEKILGFPLPNSASTYPAWWANQEGSGHSHCGAWQNIGWRTGELDLKGRKVTFFRKPSSFRRETSSSQGSAIRSALESGDFSSHDRVRAAVGGQKPIALNMAEAKAGLAMHFGVPPESIEITIKG